MVTGFVLFMDFWGEKLTELLETMRNISNYCAFKDTTESPHHARLKASRMRAGWGSCRNTSPCELPLEGCSSFLPPPMPPHTPQPLPGFRKKGFWGKRHFSCNEEKLTGLSREEREGDGFVSFSGATQMGNINICVLKRFGQERTNLVRKCAIL